MRVTKFVTYSVTAFEAAISVKSVCMISRE